MRHLQEAKAEEKHEGTFRAHDHESELGVRNREIKVAKQHVSFSKSTATSRGVLDLQFSICMRGEADMAEYFGDVDEGSGAGFGVLGGIGEFACEGGVTTRE